MERDATEALVVLVVAVGSMGLVVLVVIFRLDVFFKMLEQVVADALPGHHVVAWLVVLGALLSLGIWLAIRNRTSETDPALPGAVRESSSAQRFRPSRRPPSPISGAHRSEVYR